MKSDDEYLGERGPKIVNRTEFELLIGEHGRALYTFCRRIAYDREEADDLYQATFLRAFELADRLSPAGNPRSFLYSIAVSLGKNGRRQKARRQRIAPEEAITDENVEILTRGEDFTEEIDSEERARAVRRSVLRLREIYRLPVLLYYGGDLPIADIARILHIPTGTVKSRLNKAKILLRREMEEQGYDKNFG